MRRVPFFAGLGEISTQHFNNKKVDNKIGLRFGEHFVKSTPRTALQKIYPFGASKNREFCDKNYVIKILWWNLNFYHMEKKY